MKHVYICKYRDKDVQQTLIKKKNELIYKCHKTWNRRHISTMKFKYMLCDYYTW